MGNGVKKRVYLHEFNVSGEGYIYLPLASGLIRAYAESIPEIAAVYEFAPFIFRREPIEEIFTRYEEPAVALFSVAAWNEQFSLSLSREIKARWPECKVIFGGPQVPSGSGVLEYRAANPWVDHLVHGEGEGPVAEILLGRLRQVREHFKDQIDLSSIPSPYLAGLYDYLFDGKDEGIIYQAIFETNRGCPYRCSFCGWNRGSGNAKVREFPLERVEAELEWIAEHRIEYIFCADGNFGLLQRDVEITKMISRIKGRCGYPEKVRVCYAKDAGDRVKEIAMLLKDCAAGKAVTIARQSYCVEAIINSGRILPRENRLTQFREDLRFAGIPAYNELILGLPGETLGSWFNGLKTSMDAPSAQLFVYLAQVFPNARLADPDYQREHEIETKKILLTPTHGLPLADGEHEEYEEIVIATKTLSDENFRYALILSWLVMALHGMGMIRNILEWMRNVGKSRMDFIRYLFFQSTRFPRSVILQEMGKFLEGHADRILSGGGRCIVLPEYGPIYWDIEEALYLILAERKEGFYHELCPLIESFMGGMPFDPVNLDRVISEQMKNVPSLSDYGKDRIAFAREIVLHGRKSGRFDA